MRRFFIHIFSSSLLLLTLLSLSGCGRPWGESLGPQGQHLVVLSDTHLPGPNLAEKEALRATINSWEEVALVIVTGDICADYGTPEEYAVAKTFFSEVHAPVLPVAGNHDYLYATPDKSGWAFLPASAAVREEKLERFRQTFGLTSHYYSKQVGRYRLIFLSTDHDRFTTGISQAQLAWFRTELDRHPKAPTIVFFHAPLWGTLRTYKPYVNQPHSIAQPAAVLHEIITTHPQIFLWVAGHTHTPPTEESFASPINVYAKQVTTIHNKDMRRGELVTNSLFLYDDRVEVRTFHHGLHAWQPQFDRTIRPPQR